MPNFDNFEPCSHKGCLNHKTHPCEKCSRLGGITLTNIDDLIYFCAFRYALGRKTYIVSYVVSELKKAKLSQQTKDQIVNEISLCTDLGMNCDRLEWLELRDRFEQELK
jgi:hypothetical protein